MKRILGLDIGTNSIGGALIEVDTKNYGTKGEIKWLGSRIIPFEGQALKDYESGSTQGKTKAALRRQKRGSRRLKHRYKLRRTRLIKVFKILGWIDETFPENFKEHIQKDPNFKFNISNFLPFSEETVKEALKHLGVENKNGELKVSEDWLVYYLRKKALTEEITLKELARVIYMMNQRRGFKSSRKDLKDTSVINYDDFKEMVDEGNFLDENGNTLETQFVEITRIKDIVQEDEPADKNGKLIFKIFPESDRMEPWNEKRKKRPDWIGKEYKFLVTLKTTKKGKVIQNKPKLPSEDDWQLSMVALDNELEGKHPGAFFFDKLKEDKNYRIRQQVVKRSRYQAELRAIWRKQSACHPELKSKDKLEEIARVLYPLQAQHKLTKWKEIVGGNLYNVIAKDIIYYQRDLKSQKHLIDECTYEKKDYIKSNGQKTGYKVAPRSCPEFQEFRIWQDIHNIEIIQLHKIVNDKHNYDVNVSSEYIGPEKKAELYELFDSKSEVKEVDVLRVFGLNTKTHKVNLFANRKTLKGNETKAFFQIIFKKYGFDGKPLLEDPEQFKSLWHILYSLNGKNAEKGIETALKNPKNKFDLPDAVIDHLAMNTKEFPRQYAAYSSKALRKLLPFMRCGEYWNREEVQEQLVKFFEWRNSQEYKNLGAWIQKELNRFQEPEDFQGLSTYMACYVVYQRHSERENNTKFNNFSEIEVFKMLPPGSLRNPIAEQVIRETLQVVKDVWENYGRPHEIHIEMARELKKTEKERRRVSDSYDGNFNEKQKIKKLLIELKEGNPESPVDVKKYQLWKENGGTEAGKKFDELFNKKNQFRVTQAEIKKYGLWADQNHRCPYTGESIGITDLFEGGDYNIDHIIPQAKLKYDAYENLVVCKRTVNDFKGKRLARVMIEEGGSNHELLSPEEYVAHCQRTFSGRKLKNLLREDVPEGFISRQLNDTRYINRKLTQLLWPVAEDKEGIVFTIGGITDDLKRNWGFNELWKTLLTPRFERLEGILGEKLIEPNKKDENKIDLHAPDEKVVLKRVDHRHHALDALIIAATRYDHIKYFNSLNAASEKEKYKYLIDNEVREFILPWPHFTKHAKEHLQKVIVSYKMNHRILSTPHNRYLKWEQQADGQWKKVLKKQKKNKNWKAVKKSMFKENPSGLIYLKEIKEQNLNKAVQVQIERQKGVKDQTGKPRDYIYDKYVRSLLKDLCSKYGEDLKALKKAAKNLTDQEGQPIDKVRIAVFKEYAAKRVSIDKSFTEKKIKNIPYAERIIERCDKRMLVDPDFAAKPASWPLPFLFMQHLREYDMKPAEAFQGEGLELLQKIAGKPIKKVTTYEGKSNPIKLNGKILETDKGGNVYFVIHKNLQNGEHEQMYSVPLYSSEQVSNLKDYGAINRLLNKMPIAEERTGCKTIVLSPRNLVYVPTQQDLENPFFIKQKDWNGSDRKNVFDRVYKMVSCTGARCYFIPHNVAKSLTEDHQELGHGNKSECDWDGNMIKRRCIPIRMNRMGEIIEVDGLPLVK